MTEYKSRTVTVDRSPMTLFNALTDLSGLSAAIPADKVEDIKVDGDSVHITVSGFSIGIKASEKVPFSKVCYEDDGAPFHFVVTFDLGQAADPLKTDLTITVSAELNFMMKTLLGNKIKEALDKLVTDISVGGMFPNA